MRIGGGDKAARCVACRGAWAVRGPRATAPGCATCIPPTSRAGRPSHDRRFCSSSDKHYNNPAARRVVVRAARARAARAVARRAWHGARTEPRALLLAVACALLPAVPPRARLLAVLARVLERARLTVLARALLALLARALLPAPLLALLARAPELAPLAALARVLERALLAVPACAPLLAVLARARLLAAAPALLVRAVKRAPREAARTARARPRAPRAVRAEQRTSRAVAVVHAGPVVPFRVVAHVARLAPLCLPRYQVS